MFLLPRQPFPCLNKRSMQKKDPRKMAGIFFFICIQRSVSISRAILQCRSVEEARQSDTELEGGSSCSFEALKVN